MRRVHSLRQQVWVCTRCHRATHFGFAEVTGQGPQAHARLRSVNGWIVVDVDAHIAMAAAMWVVRSRVGWTLDLGMLTAVGVVTAHPAPAALDRRHIATDILDCTTRDER